jgi:hypothetical protein
MKRSMALEVPTAAPYGARRLPASPAPDHGSCRAVRRALACKHSLHSVVAVFGDAKPLGRAPQAA